jgi:hypothetical protein
LTRISGSQAFEDRRKALTPPQQLEQLVNLLGDAGQATLVLPLTIIDLAVLALNDEGPVGQHRALQSVRVRGLVRRGSRCRMAGLAAGW